MFRILSHYFPHPIRSPVYLMVEIHWSPSWSCKIHAWAKHFLSLILRVVGKFPILYTVMDKNQNVKCMMHSTWSAEWLLSWLDQLGALRWAGFPCLLKGAEECGNSHLWTQQHWQIIMATISWMILNSCAVRHMQVLHCAWFSTFYLLEQRWNVVVIKWKL